MFRKVCFYIFLFFCFVLNIILDINARNYFKILSECFNKNIILTSNLHMLICFIIALISILIVIDILLVISKNKIENKGAKFKSEDGTFGTADWMSEKEMKEILGTAETPGIILGKYHNQIIKLPFASHFNKNICVFGSSGSMKTIRFFAYKSIRTFKI